MGLKILIVEDVFIEADHLGIFLTQAGHSVTGVAKTVDQALNCIKKQSPDIVLLDIFLKGDKTGIHLGGILGPSGIPFIYLSANSNPSTLDAAKETNPYGFLVKPFREKDILIALEIAVHRHRHVRDTLVRQEELLSSVLGRIIKGVAGREQILLLLLKGLQQCVPFDYILIDLKGDENGIYFFKRSNREEYQRLDVTVFIRKAQLEFADLVRFRAKHTQRDQILLRNEADFENACLKDRLLDGMRRFHRIRSSLTMPLTTADERRSTIVFFSTSPAGFDTIQVELLEALRAMLTTVIDNAGKDAAETAGAPLTIKDARRSHEARMQGIIGHSPKLLRVMDLVMQVASVNSTVLILGETGVGKEGVAGAIHQLSPRRGKPLVRINCSAIPATLVESELFGHERGAFTNATERRIGKFEQAEGGTIFLDEIGELPIGVQAKLLRVLQEREIERLGSSVTTKIDVRIIVATNRDLHAEVRKGRFRMDLYYRLLVFPIVIPPLRERKEDIPLLAQHFLSLLALTMGSPVKTLSAGALEQLMSYSWPGNIRELQHLLEREVLSAHSDVIDTLELPGPLADGHSASASQQIAPASLSDKEAIMLALKQCNGKVAGKGGAAEALGINANTLSTRMRKLGIKWKYILTIVFWFALIPARTQRIFRLQFDSMTRRLDLSKKDTQQLFTLLRMAEFHIRKTGEFQYDLDSAKECIDRAKTMNEVVQSRDADGYILLMQSLLNREEPNGMATAKRETQEAVDILRQGHLPLILGHALVSLSWYGEYRNEDELTAKIDLLEQALVAFNRSGSLHMQGECLEQLTDLYLNQGNVKKAEQDGIMAIDRYQAIGYPNIQGPCILVANAYSDQLDYTSAMKYALMALDAIKTTHDGTAQFCQVYYVVAVLFVKMQEWDKALPYYKAALDWARTHHHMADLYTVETSLVGAYVKFNQAKDAVALVESTGNTYGIPKDSSRAIGFFRDYVLSYSYDWQWDKARIWCNRLLHRTANRYDDQMTIANTRMLYYVLSRQYTAATAEAPKYRELMTHIADSSYLSNCYQWLFRLDTAIHQNDQAVQDLLHYQRLKDSIFSITRTRQIDRLQLDYATAEKENNIKLLQKETEIQKEDIARSNQTRNYSIAGAALVLLVGFGRYRLKQRQNRQLELNQREISAKNDQLEKLLRENEWLMRELHHRVKNNLQIVVSLLSSQSARLQDEAASNAVRDSRLRVQSMALIHQKLYKSDNVSAVDMEEYVTDMVEYLRDNVRPGLHIGFDVNVEQIWLDVVQAVLVGLILNEVITNSIKHAFPAVSAGRISVCFTHLPNGFRCLKISDEGIGMPTAIEPSVSASFGLRLIRGLAEDLEANVETHTDAGTTWIFTFLSL
jgi:transcriptional regulator with GAF, ATPase, and Fis domain/two-component sensor histidine kinase/AmiR/NasT family two-component response regulator